MLAVFRKEPLIFVFDASLVTLVQTRFALQYIFTVNESSHPQNVHSGVQEGGASDSRVQKVGSFFNAATTSQ